MYCFFVGLAACPWFLVQVELKVSEVRDGIGLGGGGGMSSGVVVNCNVLSHEACRV